MPLPCLAEFRWVNADITINGKDGICKLVKIIDGLFGQIRIKLYFCSEKMVNALLSPSSTRASALLNPAK
jgi:hypothetical protein